MQPKPFLRTLKIIHASLCMGLIFCSGFVFMQNGGFEVALNNDVFIFVVPIIAITAYFGNKWVYQNLIQNLPKTEALSKKLQRYYAASLVKYAIIEGASFLALFAYYYKGTAMHLVIALCLMIYLFFQRPTLERLKQELPLNLEEKKIFNTLQS